MGPLILLVSRCLTLEGSLNGDLHPIHPHRGVEDFPKSPSIIWIFAPVELSWTQLNSVELSWTATHLQVLYLSQEDICACSILLNTFFRRYASKIGRFNAHLWSLAQRGTKSASRILSRKYVLLPGGRSWMFRLCHRSHLPPGQRWGWEMAHVRSYTSSHFVKPICLSRLIPHETVFWWCPLSFLRTASTSGVRSDVERSKLHKVWRMMKFDEVWWSLMKFDEVWCISVIFCPCWSFPFPSWWQFLLPLSTFSGSTASTSGGTLPASLSSDLPKPQKEGHFPGKEKLSIYKSSLWATYRCGQVHRTCESQRKTKGKRTTVFHLDLPGSTWIYLELDPQRLRWSASVSRSLQASEQLLSCLEKTPKMCEACEAMQSNANQLVLQQWTNVNDVKQS